MTWLLYEKGALSVDHILDRLAPSFSDITLLHCHDMVSTQKVMPGDLVILYAPLETLRHAAMMIAAKEGIMAVLPREDNRIFIKAFNIPKRFDDALKMLLNTAPAKVDLLSANGIPVFSYLTLGEMSRLRPQGNNGDPLTFHDWYRSIKESLSRLKQIRFQSITIKTAKGQQVQTAVMGVTIIENSNSPILRHILEDEPDSYDGHLNAFIWAPRSIMSLIWYWFRLGIFGKFHKGSLPDSIGLVQTTQLLITSSKPIEFSIDGTAMAAKELEASILPGVLKVIHGNGDETAQAFVEGKESFKVSNLPRGEMAQELILEPLPLFSCAGEDEFRELFLQLRQSAVPGRSFFILMILSTVLAAMGLFLNSASVIIGAMILAPLMAPILSLAMATARNNRQLISQSLFTLSSGIGVAIAIAALLSALMPLELITQEMRSRLSPNLLDLVVAIVSGIAGAYAYAREDIAKSLPGVAIAVALVPPLTVTGIGIGFADWYMVGGSFLLFITNLVGIIIAAIATFLILGFAPLRMAKKGLGVTAVLLAVIIPPLMISFYSMTLQSRVSKQLINREFRLESTQTKVKDVLVIQTNPLEIELKLSANEPLRSRDFDQLKDDISTLLKKELSLRISYEIIR